MSFFTCVRVLVCLFADTHKLAFSCSEAAINGAASEQNWKCKRNVPRCVPNLHDGEA